MHSNHETVARRVIEDVWNNGKFETLDQLVTPDVAHHDPVNPIKGLEAYKNVVKKYRTAFPDMRQEIQDLFSAGDNVVMRLTCTGTHRGPLEGLAPTGRPVKVSAIVMNHFSGDRISEDYVNWDSLGMLQQLGVVTLPGKVSAAGA